MAFLVQNKLIFIFLSSVCFIARTKDLPTVVIPKQGTIIGRELTVARGQKSIVYYGIPFAHPPTGNLRFAAPKTHPLPSWGVVKNESSFSAACMQSLDRLKQENKLLPILLPDPQGLEISEDCLYLNIFQPDGAPPPEGWPVLLWFHSGDFSSGATALWDASVYAVRQKVLIVTAAYRLNVFGFLTIKNGVAPGNYGLLDQLAALDWVNNKITLFGGSSSNICIFGHSAGGISVGLHMVSPLSAGKFHKAISMSGSALAKEAVTEPEVLQQVVEEIGRKFDCYLNPLDLLDCLRRASVNFLTKYATELSSWVPVIDGINPMNNSYKPFLPSSPQTLMESGEFSKVPFLTGYTDMEEALTFATASMNPEKGLTKEEFETQITDVVSNDVPLTNVNDSCTFNIPHVVDSVLFYYTPQPETNDFQLLRDKCMDFFTEKKFGAGAYLQAKKISEHSPNTPIYVYRFDYKPKKHVVPNIPDWIKAPHQFDLPFMWGMPYWPSLTSIVWNGADRKMSDTIMGLWASFIKFSNPSQSPGINVRWDAFTDGNPGIMVIDRSLNMSDPSTFDYKAFEFWNIYYPKVLDISMNCCNTTDGTNSLYYTKSQKLYSVMVIINILIFIALF